jgi:Peptidase family M13
LEQGARVAPPRRALNRALRRCRRCARTSGILHTTPRVILEALIDQLRTDSHLQARYRVLGPLANVPEFAQAFNCPAGAPMMRATSEQISIW